MCVWVFVLMYLRKYGSIYVLGTLLSMYVYTCQITRLHTSQASILNARCWNFNFKKGQVYCGSPINTSKRNSRRIPKGQ
jgi:hypothetical protein